MNQQDGNLLTMTEEPAEVSTKRKIIGLAVLGLGIATIVAVTRFLRGRK